VKGEQIMARTVGIIESRSLVDLMEATDRASKSADVRFVRYERIGEGRVATVMEGDIANLQIALEAARNGHHENGISTRLLTNVDPGLLGVFGLPGGKPWRW
jgi:ethanolamine utilization protein EutM